MQQRTEQEWRELIEELRYYLGDGPIDDHSDAEVRALVEKLGVDEVCDRLDPTIYFEVGLVVPPE